MKKIILILAIVVQFVVFSENHASQSAHSLYLLGHMIKSDSVDCLLLSNKISRLNNILNSRYCYDYLLTKGYLKYNDTFGFIQMADCYLDKEDYLLKINIYIALMLKQDFGWPLSPVELEEGAKITRKSILELCKEVISQNITMEDIIIRVKSLEKNECKDGAFLFKEEDLFICEGNEIKYFPRYFQNEIFNGRPIRE